MSVTAISAVLFSTADGPRLVAFYRDRLGVPLTEERHGSELHWGCHFDGVHFAIHQEKGVGSGHPIALSFDVANVDQTFNELKQAGVATVDAPVTRPYGRLASVRDPDGNVVYLHGS